jgi:nitroreductase
MPSIYREEEPLDPQTVLELIKGRRSRRKFSARPVDEALVEAVLEAGRWAPSGANNQPWRFVVVREAEVKARLAAFTHYGKIIENAPVVIPVFIHRPSMYNDTKDHQSMGACLQNMLLMAEALGLGAVWLGEILKNAEGVREALGLSPDLALMAVVALGWPAAGNEQSQRKPLAELVLAPRG